MIALVVTVRNAAHLLPDQLAVHRALGVDRAYVYDDGSTDGTVEALSGLDFATVRPTVAPEAYGTDPRTALWVERHAQVVTARQCLNAFDALTRAHEDGAAWLIHVDADEIALPPHRSVREGALRAFLERRRRRVDAVQFRVLECLQDREDCRDPLVELTRFKDARRRVVQRWYDPTVDRVRKDDWIYGHREGKTAVRLGRRELRPRGVHHFEALDGDPLRTVKAGWLLHYAWTGAREFARRSRTSVEPPMRWLHGGEDPHRLDVWRNLRAGFGLSDAELEQYFRDWVRFSPNLRAPVVYVPQIAALVSRLRAARPAGQ